jgi:hypothetical protein
MGYSGSHANGLYVVYIPETKKYVVSRNVKFDEGKCDEVIHAAQATIVRIEEFEKGASKIRTMVDKHTAPGSDVPPANELLRLPFDHPLRHGEAIDAARKLGWGQTESPALDPMNPETGTNEEITKAGQTAAAGAKIAKKKAPAKKKTVKIRMNDKLMWTKKTAKAPYINERVKAMDELTVEEALTRRYRDSEGTSVLYKRADLIYDLNTVRLEMISHTK